MKKKNFFLAFLFFLAIKILLAGLAFWAIWSDSLWITAVFGVFIALDLADGRILGEGSRLWDTIGDRIFAYTCFLAFAIFRESLFPTIILIWLFLVKDALVLVFSFYRKIGTIESNNFDRLTILATAVYFVMSVIGLEGQGMTIFFGSTLILIFFQAFFKLKKINSKKTNKA